MHCRQIVLAFVCAACQSPGAITPEGAGSVLISDGDAATRAGKGDFDATGFVPCARHLGQPTTSCALGVAREGGGTATVVVTHPDGFRRALFFVEGKFLSADTSQSDGYPEYSATKESDLNFIRVGPERYEIPDAVTFGG